MFCANAFAGDVTITGAQTTSVSTSNADGNGPGNVTIAQGGAINIAGGDAVIVDSSNSVTNNGTLTVPGIDSYGIKTTVTTAGSIINGVTGVITTAGSNSVGIYTGAGVGGPIINQGSITTGAVAGTDSLGNAQGAVSGGHALWVAGSVGGGILLDGDGITKANEPATLATPDSSLTTIGGAEAFYIGQSSSGTPSNIVISPYAGDPSGASVVVRGNITSSNAIASTGLQALTITGATINGVNYTTTLTGAFYNAGGDIDATGVDTPTTAMTIGAFAKVPAIVNSGAIYAKAGDSSEASDGTPGSGGGNAYALVINAQGNLAQLVNSGSIIAESHGATQSAYAVVDNSGTLTSVTNSGTVTASVKGTGSTTAFDLSHGTQAITFTNSGTIAGDILLGNAGNTFTSTGGSLSGALNTGDGNDTVSLSNTTMLGTVNLGAGNNSFSATNVTLTGGVVSGTGATTANFSTVNLAIPSNTSVTVTNAHFSNASGITFNIDATTGNVGGVVATGNVVVDSGTTITTVVNGPVTNALTAKLIQAGSLTFNADLSGQQPQSTVMYNKQILLAPGNPNVLELAITRNTASQLGLSSNLGATYENLVPALTSDSDLAASLGGITSRSDFTTAINALMPDASEAVRDASLGAEDMAESAIRRRLEGLLRDRDDELGRYRDSYWVQEYTTYGSKGGSGEIAGFRNISQSVAAGLDAEIGEGVQAGVSANETLSFLKENQTSNRSIDFTRSGLDFYMRSNNEWGFVEGIAGAAYNSYSSNRSVTIADSSRAASASWSGNQLDGALDVGTVIGSDTLRLSPYLRGSYTRTFAQSYTETGGGAVDLTYVGGAYESIRAGGGAVAEYQLTMGSFDMLNLDAHADYAHEFKNSITNIRAEFAGTGDFFNIQGLKPNASVITGGIGAQLKYRFSSLSFDYDAQYLGGYLAHTLTVTWRHRF